MVEDEFTPCRFMELDGKFHLAFDDFDANDAGLVFDEAGFDGGGYGWHGVVEALVGMRAPKIRRKLRYDPEAGMFSVSSKDRDALRQVAGLIREAVAEPSLLREAISKADPEVMEG